jgi:hypothetical protein
MMSFAYLEKLFAYKHLPDHLQRIPMPFYDLAVHLYNNSPQNPELTSSLRKLLEAKDAAVRAAVIGTV